MAQPILPLLHVIYAGRGDALVLEYDWADQRQLVILDGGPKKLLYKKNEYEAPYTKYFVSSVIDIWRKMPGNAHLPLAPVAIINSHPDDDHYDGILELLKSALKDKTWQRLAQKTLPDGPMYFNGPLILPRAYKPDGFLDKTANDRAIEIFGNVLKKRKFEKDKPRGQNPLVPGINIEYPERNDLIVWERKEPLIQPRVPGIVEDDDGSSLHAVARGTEGSVSDLIRKVPKQTDLDKSTTNLSSILMNTVPQTGGCIVGTGDNVASQIRQSFGWPGQNTPIDIYKIQHHGSVKNAQLEEALVHAVPNFEAVAIECALRELMEMYWGHTANNIQNPESSHRQTFFAPVYSQDSLQVALPEVYNLMEAAFAEDNFTRNDCLEYLKHLRIRDRQFLMYSAWSGAANAANRPPLNLDGWHRGVDPSTIYYKIWNTILNASKQTVEGWTENERHTRSTVPALQMYNQTEVNSFFSWNTLPAQQNGQQLVPTKFWHNFFWADDPKGRFFWLAYYTNLDSIRRSLEFYQSFNSYVYVVSANGSYGHPSPSVVAALALAAAEGNYHRCLYVTNGFAVSTDIIKMMVYWAYRANPNNDMQNARRLTENALGPGAAQRQGGSLSVRYLNRGVYMSLSGNSNYRQGNQEARERTDRTAEISFANGVADLDELYKALETDKSVIPIRSTKRKAYFIKLRMANNFSLDLPFFANAGLNVTTQQPSLYDIKEHWESEHQHVITETEVPIHIKRKSFMARTMPLLCDFILTSSPGRRPPPPQANFGLGRFFNLNLTTYLAGGGGGAGGHGFPGVRFMVQDMQLAAVSPSVEVSKATATATKVDEKVPSKDASKPVVIDEATKKALAENFKQEIRSVSLEEFCKIALIALDLAHPWTVQATLDVLLGVSNTKKLGLVRPIELAILGAQIIPKDTKVVFEQIGFNILIRSAHTPFTFTGTNAVSLQGEQLKSKQGDLNVQWPDKKPISVNTDLIFDEGAVTIKLHREVQLDQAIQPCSLERALIQLAQQQKPTLVTDFKKLALPKVLGLLTNRSPGDMAVYLLDRLPTILIKKGFLQQTIDLKKSTVTALPSPVGGFAVRNAELVISQISQQADVVNNVLTLVDADLKIKFEDVKIILKDGNMPREKITFVGAVKVGEVTLSCSVELSNPPPSADSLNASAVNWKFQAHNDKEPLKNILSLWKSEKTAKVESFGKDTVPFSSSSLSDLNHSGVGFVLSQPVARNAQYRVSSVFAATKLSSWKDYLPESIAKNICKTGGAGGFDVEAHLEIRNPLDEGLRALALALNFEIEIPSSGQLPGNDSSKAGSVPVPNRRLQAVLMAEPMSGTKDYDYRVRISASDDGVTIPDVIRAVGLGDKLELAIKEFPMLDSLNKLHLKQLAIALEEKRTADSKRQYSISDFDLAVTLDTITIYNNLKITNTEVSLSYSSEMWTGSVRGVLRFGEIPVSVAVVLPQTDVEGLIEISAPRGLRAIDAMQALGTRLPSLVDLPFPEVAQAVASVSLDHAKIQLRRTDKIHVSGLTFELSLSGTKLGHIDLTHLRTKIGWQEVEDNDKKVQGHLSLGIEALANGGNQSVSVAYDSQTKMLIATFHAAKPTTISEMIKFVLNDNLPSNPIMDFAGGLGISHASVVFDTGKKPKPMAFCITLQGKETVDIEKTTLRSLELSYVAGVPQAAPKPNGEKSPEATPFILSLTGLVSNNNVGATFKFLTTWGAATVDPSVTVEVSPPTDPSHGALSLTGLGGLLGWPSLPDPVVPLDATNPGFFTLNIVEASGKVEFHKDPSDKKTKVKLSSLLVIVESRNPYVVHELSLTLQRLSFKLDYDQKREEKQRFKGNALAYLEFAKGVVLELEYFGPSENNRLSGKLHMVGQSDVAKIPSFQKTADDYLGKGSYEMPPNLALPKSILMTKVSAEYIPGKRFEISGADESFNWLIDTFSPMDITLKGLGGQIVRNLGSSKTLEAYIYASVSFSSFVSGKALLHLTKSKTTSAMLIAQLSKLSQAHDLTQKPNDVAAIVNSVGDSSISWTAVSPGDTRQDLVFAGGDTSSLKLVLDFQRKNFIMAGRINGVGRALLWLRKRDTQDHKTTGDKTKTTNYSYLLCVELDSISALWPSLQADFGEWVSFDKSTLSARISSETFTVSEVEDQIRILAEAVPALPEKKDEAAVGPLAKALKKTDKVTPASDEKTASVPIVPQGACLRARIVLDERTKLSNLLMISSDRLPGNEPAIELEAHIPRTGKPAEYTISLSNFRMFEGAFILNRATGTYVAGDKPQLSVTGDLEFHLEDHVYHFNVSYYNQHKPVQTVFELKTQPPSGQAKTTTTTITSSPIAFGEMFGVSLNVTKLRGTITPPPSGTKEKKQWTCSVHGSVTIFKTSTTGQVVFVGESPKAIVCNLVSDVDIGKVYSDLIHATPGESDATQNTWPSNYGPLALKSARVYYLKSTTQETVMMEDEKDTTGRLVPISLAPKFNISADIELFGKPFAVVVNLPSDKSGVEIVGSYKDEIKLGFCTLTKSTAPGSQGPGIQISSRSGQQRSKDGGKNHYKLISGLSLLDHPGFELELDYSNEVYAGKASYTKDITVLEAEVKGPFSLTVEYSKGRFSFGGFKINKDVNLDLEQALKDATNPGKTKKPQTCPELIGKLFNKLVKTRFFWTADMAGFTSAGLKVDVKGFFRVMVMNSEELSVDFDLPGPISFELSPGLFTLDGLIKGLEKAMLDNLTHLGENILGDSVKAAKIFGVMALKELLPQAIAALLCRDIKPPGIWPAVDWKLPPDDKPGEKPPQSNPKAAPEPTSWWDKFWNTVGTIFVVGSLFVGALAALGEGIATFAEFVVAAEEAIVLLDKAIKALRALKDLGKLSKTDAAKLQRYEKLRTDFTKVKADAGKQIELAKTSLRQKLNFTSKPSAKFSGKEGLMRLDISKVKPDEKLLGNVNASKLMWQVYVISTNTPPSSDPTAPPPAKVSSQNSADGTIIEVRRDDLKGAKEVHAWVRASYTDSLGPKHPQEETFSSEAWAQVDILLVDDENWKPGFISAFTLSGKPSVAITSASVVRADWSSNVSSVAKDAFENIGVPYWEVVLSLSQDPPKSVDPNAVLAQEYIPTFTTNFEQTLDPKLLGKPNGYPADAPGYSRIVYVHIRAIMEVSLTKSRVEGSWASGQRGPAKDSLGPTEWLAPGECLIGSKGRVHFILQDDGDFVLYQDKTLLWSSRTKGDQNKPVKAVMLDDGNLMLYDASGAVRWQSGTGKNSTNNAPNSGASLAILDDGNAIVRSKDGKTILWQTNTHAVFPPSRRDRLQVGETLLPNQNIVSPNGQFSLAFQGDANFVVYDWKNPIWHIGTTMSTRPYNVQLGEDDNLVVNRDYKPWASNTHRREKGGRAALIIRDDGAAIIESDGIIIWSTKAELVQPWEPVDLVLVKPGSDRMRQGEFLAKGQSLTSPNGKFTATLQQDGNFDLYYQLSESLGKSLFWSTVTTSNTITRLCFGKIPRQLNLYSAGAQVKWSPQAGREWDPGHVFQLGNDGNLCILPDGVDPSSTDGEDKRAWCSNSATVGMLEKDEGFAMLPGQCILPDQLLISPNGKFHFYITGTGDMQVSTNTQNVLTTFNPLPKDLRHGITAFCFLTSGHLQIRGPAYQELWKDGPGTTRREGEIVKFVMRDDGTPVLQLFSKDKSSPPGQVIWEILKPVSDRLLTGQCLRPGQQIRSRNGAYDLAFQQDANLVLYKFAKPDPVAPSEFETIWSSDTGSWVNRGDRAALQKDGNFVVYESGDYPLWSSQTYTTERREVFYTLIMQDDGEAVIYKEENERIWGTKDEMY
ncbi:Mannose-specific lectin [Cladobotryum mycophilum]|uniref:Mannose-specific lectin n=1 Tax=Cladobotryum mycophilum TaxID=491253 RepID=A0ABR0SR18_9HYPO